MYTFAGLVRAYPSWPLSEVKGLTRRERQFWLELAQWNITPKG